MGGTNEVSKKKPSLHSKQEREGVAEHTLQFSNLIEHNSQVYGTIEEFGYVDAGQVVVQDPEDK